MPSSLYHIYAGSMAVTSAHLYPQFQAAFPTGVSHDIRGRPLSAGDSAWSGSPQMGRGWRAGTRHCIDTSARKQYPAAPGV